MSAGGAVDIIGLALAEDIGGGDLTTQYFIPPGRRATALLSARQPCVLAGLGVAEEVFRRLDPALVMSRHAADGDVLTAGSVVLEIRGEARPLLTGERVALNFVQRLSGVATLARRYVDAVAGTGARILDTRKTTPGLRALEKAAARAGGCTNHRQGLFDMIMVKDNHLAAGAGAAALAAGIREAKCRTPGLRAEVEVDTLEQFLEVAAIDCVDVILLDNMPPALLRQAVAAKRPGLLLEASGGITLANIRETAETGVDFISVGAITHSAPAIDFGLDFQAGS